MTTFTHIDTYMLLSKDERQSHLCLDEPCIEIGGNSGTSKGLLAHFLLTTIPTGIKVHCCHACNNAKCSNPRHLYWGSPKENAHDAKIAGIGWYSKSIERKNPIDILKTKHGNNFFSKIASHDFSDSHKDNLRKASKGKKFMNDGNRGYWVSVEDIPHKQALGWVVGRIKR